MFRNYFKIAWRNLVRHAFFSFINIFCLAIGTTFSLVIGVYVFSQYNINRSLKNAANQYIVKSDWKVKEMGLDITTFGPLAKTLKQDYPALVADYFRFNPVTNVVSAGDKHFKENIAICDTSLISMYGFEVLKGNARQAFANNNSAVITEAMAKKLFGETDVLNKVISVRAINNSEQVYSVSAVVKDIPFNSVTNLVGDTYNVFVPTIGNTYYGNGDPAEGWGSAFEVSMIQLKPGVTPKQLEQPIRQILKKNTSEAVQKNLTVRLAPVTNYYLTDHNNAVLKMILVLSISAAFILIMAVINFININIGASSYRLKEIGLRKVFGGERKQLIVQFITEALVLTFLAALFSLLLYQLLRPLFNSILNTSLPSLFSFGTALLLCLTALIIFTGFIAGIYPAFVLSASNVVQAVKGKVNSSKNGSLFRKAMLVVQFTMAIVVLISAYSVSQQVSYIFSKDIGYQKDQVMVITAFPKQWDSAGMNRMMAMRDALAQLPDVKSASLSFEIPDRKPPNSFDIQPENGDGRTVLITACGTDENYAKTFGLQMLSGACFAQTGDNVPNQVVLNEAAVKALGLTVKTAVNTHIKSPSSGTLFTVAGVVKNYNYSSLQNGIEPLAFFNVKDALSYRYLSVKLDSHEIAASIDRLRDTWKKLSPNSPFDFMFMDDKFQSLYQTELQLQKAAYTATVLALVIVMLGMIGLISVSIEKRVKEIGIRRVLGSSVAGIIFLFMKEFVWIILIGSLIASPLAYLFVHNWLNNYTYRIDISASPFVISIICLAMMTAVLIVLQTFKAAIANPVKSLRTE